MSGGLSRRRGRTSSRGQTPFFEHEKPVPGSGGVFRLSSIGPCLPDRGYYRWSKRYALERRGFRAPLNASILARVIWKSLDLMLIGMGWVRNVFLIPKTRGNQQEAVSDSKLSETPGLLCSDVTVCWEILHGQRLGL